MKFNIINIFTISLSFIIPCFSHAGILDDFTKLKLSYNEKQSRFNGTAYNNLGNNLKDSSGKSVKIQRLLRMNTNTNNYESQFTLASGNLHYDSSVSILDTTYDVKPNELLYLAPGCNWDITDTLGLKINFKNISAPFKANIDLRSKKNKKIDNYSINNYSFDSNNLSPIINILDNINNDSNHVLDLSSIQFIKFLVNTDNNSNNNSNLTFDIGSIELNEIQTAPKSSLPFPENEVEAIYTSPSSPKINEIVTVPESPLPLVTGEIIPKTLEIEIEAISKSPLSLIPENEVETIYTSPSSPKINEIVTVPESPLSLISLVTGETISKTLEINELEETHTQLSSKPKEVETISEPPLSPINRLEEIHTPLSPIEIALESLKLNEDKIETPQVNGLETISEPPSSPTNGLEETHKSSPSSEINETFEPLSPEINELEVEPVPEPLSLISLATGIGVLIRKKSKNNSK